ncbi:N-acetylmuramoyl-L-alanine amidase [Fodinibius sp.]|uniref:N-acetylmuramoyl-L-alanine amidase family protein n=1 Tax=Fodinibius sp. TaxID=1872440 RepID=UPI0035626592
MQQPADSFRVYQPETHLIQLAIFNDKIDPENITVPDESSLFGEVQFYDIPNGIGVDIWLNPDNYYESQFYPDAESDDLLLGLSHTDRQVLEQQTQGLAAIRWTESPFPPDSLQPEEEPLPENTNYDRVKDKMKFDVVVLDPGHGGHDTGAIGHNNILEKKVVLQIAEKVGGYINEHLPDVEVVYTRDDDRFIELEERGRIANRQEGDLFVSIHCNSNHSRQPYGSEVYFLGLERSQTALEVMKRENKVVRADSNVEQKQLSQEELLIYELANSGYISTSERIAGMLEHQFSERAQRRSRGVKQARFVVLYHASMPAVLIETGFISNPNEAQYLTTEYGQNIMASAIFRAIRDYKQQYERNYQLQTE